MGIGIDEESSEERPKKPLPPLLSKSGSLFGGFDGDDDLNTLNDPYTTQLDDPPVLGGRISSLGGAQGMVGRATSPKLFVQASQFPTCTQLKVMKWENGVPVSIGSIDSQADESDFSS